MTLFAILALAALPQAQRPDTLAVKDSAAIRAAAVVSHRHETAQFPYFVVHREQAFVRRMVADTAWVALVDPYGPLIDYPSVNGSAAGTGVRAKVVRVERRAGKWVRKP